MNKKRVFISFDFDNDLSLKTMLAGQAKLPDSPFEISDWSLKEASLQKDWEEKALSKIKRSDIVVVITGKSTWRASGVKKEVNMARNCSIKIVQIKPQGSNPIRVENAGVLYDWTWGNLKLLLS